MVCFGVQAGFEGFWDVLGFGVEDFVAVRLRVLGASELGSKALGLAVSALGLDFPDGSMTHLRKPAPMNPVSFQNPQS